MEPKFNDGESYVEDDVHLRRDFLDRVPAAWTWVIEQWSGPLLVLAREFRLARLDAEEALAETWLRVLRAAVRYDPCRPMFPWLAAIFRHRCLQLLRDAKRRGEPLRDEHAAPPARESGTGQVNSEEVGRALARLTAREGEIASLHWVSGVPVRAIALLLTMTENAVHQRLHHARHAMGWGRDRDLARRERRSHGRV